LVVVWLRLLSKVLFTCKHIKIILLKKNYFWYKCIKMIWKHKKYINLKLKKLNFFKSVFETQKQTEFDETQLQKHVKTASQKLYFKLNFVVDPTVKKYSLVCYQTPYCVFASQTRKLEVNKCSLNWCVVDRH
jgi:hypothetical protein